MKLDLLVDLSTDNDVVADNLETSVITDGLKYTTGNVLEVKGISACHNFTCKAISVLKSLGRYEKIYWIQKVVYENSKQEVFVLNILNNSYTAMIFDTFKKLGINLTNLRIGYTVNYDKMFLTNKLLRDLNKFGMDSVTQIGMYLISLTYLFHNLTTNTVNLNYEPAVDTVTVDKEINGYLYDFKTPRKVLLTELDVEDLSSITYYRNSYSAMASNCNSYPGTFGLLKYTNATGTEFLNIIYNYGARAMNSNFVRICPNLGCDLVLVNNLLNVMDLDTDSIFSLIASCSNSSVQILYIEDLKLKKDMEYSITGYDEESCPENIKTLASKLISIGVSEAFNIIEASKLLGIKLKAEGIFDSSSVKSQYDEDAYAQELYKQVQDYYDSFDLKDLTPIVKSFAKGDTYSVVFYGPSGTGKSTAARVIPYKCGFPYISVNFSTNIEESDLIGTMIPNPEKKNPEDPEFIWQDGILTKAVRAGYTSILEEINFARPGILGKLNSLLDENRQIELPTGEIVRAHKNYRMIATCNIAYEGTQRFNKAFINRFELAYEFEELPREELINVIMARTGYADRSKIEKILNVYDAVKKYSKEQNLDLVISLRQLLNLFKQGKYFKNAQAAVKVILINGAFIEDGEYKENFVDTILKAFDLKFKI